MSQLLIERTGMQFASLYVAANPLMAYWVANNFAYTSNLLRNPSLAQPELNNRYCKLRVAVLVRLFSSLYCLSNRHFGQVIIVPDAVATDFKTNCVVAEFEPLLNVVIAESLV